MITDLSRLDECLHGTESGFFHCDCMDLMKLIPDKIIPLAIVDPPYGISITERHKAKRGSVPLVGGGWQTIRRFAEVTGRVARQF